MLHVGSSQMSLYIVDEYSILTFILASKDKFLIWLYICSILFAFFFFSIVTFACVWRWSVRIEWQCYSQKEIMSFVVSSQLRHMTNCQSSHMSCSHFLTVWWFFSPHILLTGSFPTPIGPLVLPLGQSWLYMNIILVITACLQWSGVNG